MREDDAANPAFLDRLRAGDARAFEELVRIHQHRLFGVALRMLDNAAEAEEVAQEAFLRAHASLGEFRGDAKLSTWLYAIVSRAASWREPSTARSPIFPTSGGWSSSCAIWKAWPTKRSRGCIRLTIRLE